MNQWKCTTCELVGFKPKLERKGNWAIEILLYCMYIIPGVIYSVWRRSNRAALCPRCLSKHIYLADIPEPK